METGILLFILLLFGGWMIFTGFFPRVSPAAEKAVASRAGKKDSVTVVLANKIAVKLLPFMSLEDMKRQKLRQSLAVLGRHETPELLYASAWATGAVYMLSIMIAAPILQILLVILFPGMISGQAIIQIGVVAAIVMLFIGRNAVLSEIDSELKKRREAIEWELPQFSGTVLQSLRHTRNVIEILESYKKICGPSLETEIERTLNDMRTGNHEQAVKNLAARVNSGAFTQLAQGLIGLLRGDEQTSYFQIITKDFSNMQSELIKKELLKRPGKLVINNALLLIGMVAMFLVAIGSYLMDSSAGLF